MSVATGRLGVAARGAVAVVAVSVGLVIAEMAPVSAASTQGPSAAAAPTRGPGDGVHARVVGGTPVPDGKYRFMASLQLRADGATPKEGHFCGGTLISPSHVLTAGHCVAAVKSAARGQGQLATQLSRRQLQQLQDQQNTGGPLSAIRVAVGAATLNGGDAQTRAVAGATVHPRYADDPNKDVAVVTLAKPIANVTPIDLATTGSDVLERPGSTALIVGWGNTTAQPYGPGEGLGLFHGPNRMHQVKAPLVADAECNAVYPADYVAGTTSICAGHTDTDACQGDSGGPLFKKVPGGYRQIGITSRGFGCGATGYPGIWTQVSAPSIGEFIHTATGGGPRPSS